MPFGINYKLKAKVIRVVTGAITERKWERKAPKVPDLTFLVEED